MTDHVGIPLRGTGAGKVNICFLSRNSLWNTADIIILSGFYVACDWLRTLRRLKSGPPGLHPVKPGIFINQRPSLRGGRRGWARFLQRAAAGRIERALDLGAAKQNHVCVVVCGCVGKYPIVFCVVRMLEQEKKRGGIFFCGIPVL